MKLTFSLLFILTISIGNSFAQSSQFFVNKIWESTTGSPDTLDWSTSEIDKSHYLIVLGNTITVSNGTNLLLTKYDSDGDTLWQRQFNNSYGGNDYGIALTTDANRNIFVAGTSYNGSGNDYDYVILKYDSNGNKIWHTYYNGTASSYDVPTAILLDGSGNIYVTGTSMRTSNLNDYLSMKLNSSGSIQWTRNYDYAQLSDIPGALEIDINNRLVVSGGSASTLTNWDFATQRINLSTGAQIGVVRNPSNGAGFDIVTGIAKDAYGAFYITGKSTRDDTGNDMKTVKLDTALNIIWIEYYDLDSAEDGAMDIEVDGENNIYITGYGTYPNGRTEMITVKYDTSGTEQWHRNYATLSPFTHAEARKISINPYAAVYVTGFEDDGNQSDIVTLSYDLDGNTRWLRKWSGTEGGDDIPSSLHYDLDKEKLFLVGRTDTGSLSTYVSIVYQEYEDESIPVVSDSGVAMYAAHEIIVGFAPEVVITETVDQVGREYGTVSDFVEDSVIEQMNDITGIEFDDLTVIKVFQRMVTTDTISISRLGERIKIPEFWATLLIKVPNEYSEQIICDSLKKLFPTIRYAHLDYAIHPNSFPFDDPNDDDYNLQGSLHETSSYDDSVGINAPLAWTLETGQPFIRVGILDSGIDWYHEDFGDGTFEGSKIEGGWNYELNLPLDPLDPEPDVATHGTPAAGIIGAISNNNKGIAGIAGGGESSNTGVSLFNLKSLYANYFKYIIQSIYEGALDTSFSNGFGLHIMNMSWGFLENQQWGGVFTIDTINAMKDVVRFAFRNKVTMVVARGNDPDEHVEYPSCYRDDWVISVGGSDTTGDYGNTTYGQGMDFIAPAASNMIWSPISDDFHNTYGNYGQTSAAAPHVSGIGALLMSYLDTTTANAKNLAPEDIEHIIENTCTDEFFFYGDLIEGYDDRTGWGRVNAGSALQSVYKEKYKILHYQTSTFDIDTIDQYGIINLSTNYDTIGQGTT